jgi:aryl-phospho-beta-D-glucosidase BglC (GH1 family)
MKTVRSRLAQYALSAMALLAAPAALAQQAGHYQGTNNYGGEVDIYVSDVSGALVISGEDDSDTVYCKGSSTGIGYGVGFSGFNSPITDGAATFEYLSTNVYYNGTFTFKGKKSVSGNSSFGAPLFTSTTPPPTKAAACLTKAETYTATYVGTETVPPGYHGAMAWPLTVAKPITGAK